MIRTHYDEDLGMPVWHDYCDMCDSQEWEVVEKDKNGNMHYYCKDCYETLRGKKL